MEVKGTSLKTTRDFVKTTFPAEYNNWFQMLPSKSRVFYDSALNVTKWYPIVDGYLVPVSIICKKFFNGNEKNCGEALGNYSADVALNGMYKVFLMIASPNFLMQRASKIISTYYKPSSVEAYIINDNSAGIRLIEFENLDRTLEFRFGGWCKRALELANCKDVSYTINKSKLEGAPFCEIQFYWK